MVSNQIRAIFVPVLGFQPVSFLLRERSHKAFGKLAVCDERNIHVYRFTADGEAVGILAFVSAGRNIDNEVHSAFFDERENAWFTLRADFIDFLASNIIFGKKISRVFGREKFELHIRENSHSW